MPRDHRRDREDNHHGNDDRGRRKIVWRRRVCRFCTDANNKVDFKNPRMLAHFISERGRIIPRRLTGNCAFHQRDVTTSVKRARSMALLPYTTTQQ